MLSNEKYKGDALLQKTYTVDFLSKKRLENNGEIPQYYVEESHPAIIEKEMWEAVQLEMERRKTFAGMQGIAKVDYATEDNPFAGKVICGQCGSPYGRKVWNSTDERLRRIIWRCNHKYTKKGEKGCNNRHVDDKVLYQVIINTYNAVLENLDYFIEKWKQMKKSENPLQRYKAEQFIQMFKEAKPLEEFDMDLYYGMVEKMTVFDNDRIIVTLLDGSDIEVKME